MLQESVVVKEINDLTFETETFRGKIEQCESTEDDNPREWDNVGKMVCFHNRYKLGDTDTGYKSGDFNSWDELLNQIVKDNPGCVIQPLYLYDHGGITISTGRFSCPWDSGQIGFIFVSKEAALKAWGKPGAKVFSKKLKERAAECIEAEVETYDTYLRGEVYHFRIIDKRDDNVVDSCCGYLGLEGVQEEVKGQLTWFETNKDK